MVSNAVAAYYAVAFVLGVLAALLGTAFRQSRRLSRLRRAARRGAALRSRGADDADHRRVSVPIGSRTSYILTTSGRPTALRRARALLGPDFLNADVAYLPVGHVERSSRSTRRAIADDNAESNNDDDDDDEFKDYDDDDDGGGGPPDTTVAPYTAAQFCQAVRGLRAVGGAVTRDALKTTIAGNLDRVDALAAAAGAVDTVVRTSAGRLHGHCAEAEGVRAALAAGLRRSRGPRDVDDDAAAASAVPACAVVYCGASVGGSRCGVAVAALRALGVEDIALTGRRPEAAARQAKALGIDDVFGLVRRGSPAEEVEKVDDDDDDDTEEVVDPQESGSPLQPLSRLCRRGHIFVNAASGGLTDRPLDAAPHLLDALDGAAAAFDFEHDGRRLREYCAARGVVHVAGVEAYWPRMAAQWRYFVRALRDDAGGGDDDDDETPLDDMIALLREADRRATGRGRR